MQMLCCTQLHSHFPSCSPSAQFQVPSLAHRGSRVVLRHFIHHIHPSALGALTFELPPEGRKRILHARLSLQCSCFPSGKALNAATTVLLQHPLRLQPLPCISSSSLSVWGLAEASCFLSCWRKQAQAWPSSPDGHQLLCWGTAADQLSPA